MPTVDRVRRRAEIPTSPWSRSTADQTWSKFASGSPIPMNTTWVTRRGAPSRWAATTCSTISPARSCRVNPPWPVAQNWHPIAHPAWVDTQTVRRSG